jgi:putative ABC transport system substrate-binding protein
MIRRRQFITLLGGAAAAWPIAVQAQQPKRLAVLMQGAASYPINQSNLATFIQGLRKLGWTDGQNLQIEVRWGAADPKFMEAYATDLVGIFKPDVLLAVQTGNLVALQRVTNTTPIVFIGVADPVEQRLVPSLTKPGGNITGFANPEFSIAGKWIDLLKQMVPTIARVAFVFDPDVAPQVARYASAAEAVALSLGVGVMTATIYSTAEIEPTFARLSHEPNIGLIFTGGDFTPLRAKQIVETVARYRLPAIYTNEGYMAEGGLMYYRNDQSESFRLAPFYIDLILKGTKPGDLPVQLPKKFKFIVNRKTATALGIEVPLGLLLSADEVIE